MQPAENLIDGKTVLVVGQGSIGKRHARILEESGASISVVSRHAAGAFRSIGDAMRAATFDYVVVANETSTHIESLAEVLHHGFRGTVLIEKPLASDFGDCGRIIAAPHQLRRIGVAYNLRFHPLTQKLKSVLTGKRVLSAELHVGQYLPTWRVSTNYRCDSSALLTSGGGALRDLSHEIDLALYLLGGFRRLTAHGGNFGRLDIETDELWSILALSSDGAPITLHLNYYDQPTRRFIHINADDGTHHADYVEGTYARNGAVEILRCDPDYTYRAVHYAMFDQAESTVCTLQSAMIIMSAIQAIENAKDEERWVDL